MLEYSKAAIHKIIDKFKRLAYISDAVSQSFMIVYLLYAICTDAGKMWANIPLLIISASYFVFFLVSSKANPFHKRSTTQKRMKKAVKYSKLLIKTCTLGVTMYGIYVATTHVTPLSLILTTLSILGWLLQVVFEIIKLVVEDLGTLVMEAVHADVEEVTKPITTVKNFIKKATGKEIESPKEKSKHRLWLDEKVQQVRQERQAIKQAKQQARKEKKRKALSKAAPLPIEHEDGNE